MIIRFSISIEVKADGSFVLFSALVAMEFELQAVYTESSIFFIFNL